ncbi:MAG: hypothetical protein Q7J06_06585 [Bacteroidales bacterium]|nr:hypothetical protein [Bacteroidales bacterium]
MAQIFTVEQRGIGKPDYTREIFAGKERAGIALKYNQQFRVFASEWITAEVEYPFVTGYTIVAGGKRHMRDSDTGGLLPVIIPRGRTLTIISIAYAVTQDIRVQGYIDAALPWGVAVNLGVLGGGQASYENKIRELSTTWYDPTAALPHSWDVIVYNVGGADLYGGAALLCIEEIVGTVPFSTTKECACPYCNYTQTEPISATRITCQECHREYMVTNFASLRQLGG